MRSDFIHNFHVTRKPPLCHWHTSFGVWPRYHHMPLQRFTLVSMSNLAKVSERMIPLASSQGFLGTWPLLHHAILRWTHGHSPLNWTRHFPKVLLISQQVVSYHTCDGTCLSEVVAPRTSLYLIQARTIHNPWR
jgi:hypothetical protein